jgi:two-component system, chemotaxis family, chemotaxis protein CheY
MRGTVVLIDDDRIVNKLNSLCIDRAKTFDHISIFENGQSALEFFIDKNENFTMPELIVLDINMPYMNGFEFLDALAALKDQEYDAIPVLILSSSEDQNDIDMASNYANIKKYLSKPLTPDKFKAFVDDYFGID